MAIPFAFLLGDPVRADTPEAYRYREIENHYHLEMAAENTRQIVQYKAAELGLQVKAAEANLRATSELAQAQNDANEHLTELVQGMGDLVNGVESLNETATATLDAVNVQTAVLREGFRIIAQRLLDQQKTLLDIAAVLRKPLETKMLELRTEAEKWMTNGMRRTGRERDGDFEDALRLLQDVIETRIGNQDYITWFQIGWLQWKHQGNIMEAEKAFDRAARLSAPEANPYYALSIRHLALMYYLQGKYEEAYQTIQRIMTHRDDHDACFDGARYANKTGRKEEALSLLQHCIDLQPTTIYTMFAEEDFAGIIAELLKLFTRRNKEARDNASTGVQLWADALNVVNQAREQSGHPFALPKDAVQELARARESISAANYGTLLEVEAQARARREQLLRCAREALDSAEVQAKSLANQAKTSADNRVNTARKELEQVYQKNRPKFSWVLGCVGSITFIFITNIILIGSIKILFWLGMIDGSASNENEGTLVIILFILLMIVLGFLLPTLIKWDRWRRTCKANEYQASAKLTEVNLSVHAEAKKVAAASEEDLGRIDSAQKMISAEALRTPSRNEVI